MIKQNVRDGKLVFGHKMDFKSITQPENSKLDTYYVLILIREFQRDMQQLEWLGQLRDLVLKNMMEATDSEHRQHFVRIQHSSATTIKQDVLRKKGLFFNGTPPPPNADVEKRCEDQGDYRPFNTLEGDLPFLPKPKVSQVLRAGLCDSAPVKKNLP